MNLRDTALRLAAITVIADAAKEAKEQYRAEFQKQLADVGADAAKALLEETEVAKVSLVTPKSSPTIFDEHAFFKFVEENYSEHIVKQVHEAFRKVFLENVIEVNGEAMYTPTGEFLPFIQFSQRTPYVSTRFAKGGREAVVDAMRYGSLNASDLIANTPLGIEE